MANNFAKYIDLFRTDEFDQFMGANATSLALELITKMVTEHVSGEHAIKMRSDILLDGIPFNSGEARLKAMRSWHASRGMPMPGAALTRACHEVSCCWCCNGERLMSGLLWWLT